MLNSITWGHYLSSTVLVLLFYYCFVAFRFYKWEILRIFGIKNLHEGSAGIASTASFKSSMKNDGYEKYFPEATMDSDISLTVQSFTDETRAFLNEADGTIAKRELLLALKLIAIKYSALNHAEYFPEMSQLICKEVDKKFPNIIQLKDAQQIWL